MKNIDLYEYFQFHLPGGNPYVQALNQFHVFGATQICSGCTVANCLLMCTIDATCQGVDYDSRTTSCWRHTAATVCGTPVAKPFCSHYKKMNCRKYKHFGMMRVKSLYRRLIRLLYAPIHLADVSCLIRPSTASEICIDIHALSCRKGRRNHSIIWEFLGNTTSLSIYRPIT